MNATTRTARPPHPLWLNVLTVFSAAILIGAEVFGGAFAAGWAFANWLHLDGYAVHILQGVFFLCGVAVMVRFILNARASSLSPRADASAADSSARSRPRIYPLRKFP
jgi:hypothetical protein